MPARRDITSVCVIGSGPIVIGQACEFDYAGCQALKVLREDGYRTIVINSNPATIMTDPEFADRTYIEPLDLEGVAAVLRRERPDALLPTLGGQTALNLAVQLFEAGVLEELGVELIGADVEVIRRAEDRHLFRQAVQRCGLAVPASRVVTSLEDLNGVRVPVVVRPAFTLGGHGGGFAEDVEGLRHQVARGLAESPIGQVLVEESLRGWDEFELEVMRDRHDNVVIVCSIENLDPMGVHTGDSVTVAPQMTLSDEDYQELRDAAAAVIRAVGVETGGSNIQFARQRETGEVRVIEMNPRVSRSSALASKATGYPIAKVAAKLAVGYTLDEIPNDLTKTTPASFEPTLDYVVVKFPRFAFEKFPGSDPELGTQMKSVGEAMGIGRSFGEAFLKAMRSREPDSLAVTPWAGLDDIPDGVHPWFRAEIEHITSELAGVTAGAPLEELTHEDWLRLKRRGLSDADVATAADRREYEVRVLRRRAGVTPSYRRVDSCAGEVEAASNYYYSTWGEADEEPPPATRPRVVIIGSGPNRIGQGIEFDYCCVHAVKTFRELDYETVMINCNPETVSTDYDTSDRLYFEPLCAEAVLAVLDREQPLGVVTQFGGQTPLKLAREVERSGFRIMGTSYSAIDLAEDRHRFAALLDENAIRCPPWGIASEQETAVAIAERIGYPVLVRPSYVLGGRSMRACYSEAEVRAAMNGLLHGAVLIDRFLESAVEIDVDALCDGEDVYIAGVMQHVEEAGVHSGDSTCVLPTQSVTREQRMEIDRIVRQIAVALKVVGVLNVQLALVNGDIFVLEVNPRASRTMPFVSKARGLNLVAAACHLMVGRPLASLGLPPVHEVPGVSVKAVVFPFRRLPGADILLGPEMRSTGEVMATAGDFASAFAKAARACDSALPHGGAVLFSLRPADRSAAADCASTLAACGFELLATPETASVLKEKGLEVTVVPWAGNNGTPVEVAEIVRRQECDLVVLTDDASRDVRLVALRVGIQCLTSLSAATAAATAIAYGRHESPVSLQERLASVASWRRARDAKAYV
jgi:carbamoyl-phosphate synthase large subunit